MTTPSLRHDWTTSEIETIYTSPLPDLIFRAQSIHRAHHRADQVQGCMLLSVKTGGCPEDCAYCPQSAHYKTDVSRSDLLSVEEVRRACDKHRALHARLRAGRADYRKTIRAARELLSLLIRARGSDLL